MPSVAARAAADSLTITQPDDWHLHVRDGAALKSVVPHSARHFRRAIIMPNLKPPVTTVQQAMEYRAKILAAVPPDCVFEPLMTLYLTDSTSPDDVRAAKAAGVVAYKLYPAGATTNSASGVTDIKKCMSALHAMADEGLLLLLHGEVTDSHVDMFDREAVFIKDKLSPLVEALPDLRIVMEHITTRDAAEFVASAPGNVAATITPQHITLNRNSLFQGGLRPHVFCLPILKREEHRQAVLAAAVSGNPRFFLGTDSAPHPRGEKAFEAAGALSKLEGFASFHGPDFYGLPRNTGTIKLTRKKVAVPDCFDFGESVVVPMSAGQELEWTVEG